jgi:hypothetical protein
MCVLTESFPPALDDNHLLDLVFVHAPGTTARLDSGANLLFANCGRGEALVALARRFPRSLFLGLEADTVEMSAARQALRIAGVQNLWLEAGPAELPRLTGIFDLALRLPDPAGTSLSDTVALLKPDGLLFDLYPPSSMIGAYHDAGLEVAGRIALPDGFCGIVRK